MSSLLLACLLISGPSRAHAQVASGGTIAATARIVLLANPATAGTVTGAGNFTVGTTQTLVATPADGFAFGGWSDGNPNPTRQVVVPGTGLTLGANFLPLNATFTLRVTADPATGGTVTQTPSQSVFRPLDLVTLVAKPAEGFVFVGWMESVATTDTTSAAAPVAVNPVNPLTLVMTRNRALVARFAPGVLGAEIDVQGRGVSIASGDTTPSAADDTEFGTTAVGGAIPMPVAGSTDRTATIQVGASGDATGQLYRPGVRHTFVIRNTGTANLELKGSPAVAVSGAGAADFVVTQPPVRSIPAGMSLPFDVTFLPIVAGVRVATLTVASNDADEGTYTFAIRGTGGSAPAPYIPTPERTSLTFGSEAGEFRAKVGVEVNTGGYSAVWGPAVMQGNVITLNAQFSAPTGLVTQVISTLSQVFPLGPLPAGNYTVVFKASGQTVKSATFAINSVTTVVTPAGAGRVELNPKPVGTGLYLSGTAVTLEAVPLGAPVPLPATGTITTTGASSGTLVGAPTVGPGTTFLRWSGDVSGEANPVTIKVDANKTVTAQFSTRMSLPGVTTGPVSDITATGAKLEGSVTATGGSPVTDRGFILSSQPGTSAAAQVKLSVGAGGEGSFSRLATGLAPGATYLVSAYATNAAGTAYGTPRTFVTVADQNQAPTISDLPNQTIPVGGNTGPLAFTVGDVETAADALTITAVTSNAQLIAASGILVGGAGARRTVTVTPLPGQSGSAVVTLTVKDAGGRVASDAFTVTVTPATAERTARLSPQSTQYSAAGGSINFTATLIMGGPTTALGLAIGSVPAGWSYARTDGPSVPAVTPLAGDTVQFNFAYITVPASPITFSFTVNYPAGLTGNQVFSGIKCLFRPGDGSEQVITLPSITLSPGGSPVITVSPASRVVRPGGPATLSVTTQGADTYSYQWKKDGVALANDSRISGATTRTLTITGCQFSDAGSYVASVTNSAGAAATSAAAALAVVDAQHTVSANDATANGTLTVANTLTYAGAPVALAWQAVLPDGWTYASGSGTEGDIKPAVGTSALAEWAWTTVPASPVSFSYTLNVPAGATGEKSLQAMVVFRLASGPTSLLVLPDPLITPTRPTHHSADTNADSRISLLELTRVIELYNTRNGSSRTGGYGVASGASEDGFAPEPGRSAAAAVSLARYYSADSNRDGKLSLLELTRVIEHYNYRNGSTRTGQYHAARAGESASEDGFVPGP